MLALCECPHLHNYLSVLGTIDNDDELFLNYDFDGNLDSWTTNGFGYDSGTGAAKVTAGVNDATISQVIVPAGAYVEIKTNSRWTDLNKLEKFQALNASILT